MTKKVFLVLILGLGDPSSPFMSVSHKNHNHHILVVEDRSQTLYAGDYNVGIFPIITKCKVARKAEQSAPTFTGVIANIFYPIGKNLAWHMQKYKPAGLVIRRMITCPVVLEDYKISSQFSGN